jgi:hypothetical protein
MHWLLYAPPPHPKGKSPQYPLNRRLGGPLRQYGGYGVEKNVLPLPRIEPQLSSTYPVAIPIEVCFKFSDAMEKRKISCPYQESNRITVVQLVA